MSVPKYDTVVNGDYGFKVVVDHSPVSNATADDVNIRFRKPGGAFVSKVAAKETTTTISYSTLTGDLLTDTNGEVEVVGHLVWTASKDLKSPKAGKFVVIAEGGQ